MTRNTLVFSNQKINLISYYFILMYHIYLKKQIKYKSEFELYKKILFMYSNRKNIVIHMMILEKFMMDDLKNMLNILVFINNNYYK